MALLKGGRPFGNWFPTNSTYRAKLNVMGGYRFASAQKIPSTGYYTEKCLHAKLSSSIPIYMSDLRRHDFNPLSFINISDFQPR